MPFALLLLLAVFCGGLASFALLQGLPEDAAGWWVGAGAAALTSALVGAIVIPWERRLRLGARRAVQAIDSSNDGYWVLDGEGRFVEVNDAYCRMVDLPREQIMRMKIADFEAVATQDRIRAQIQRILRAGNERFETRHRRRDGSWVDLEITVTAVDNGLLVAFLRDVSQRKAAQERINHLAFYDALTGLPNRRLLRDRIDQVLLSSARNGHRGSLIFVDLDNFKLLNDSRGHALGDELLVQVAQRLSACVRESDTVARQGGDEFVIMLADLSSDPAAATSEAWRVAEKCRVALERPFSLSSGDFHVSGSFGVVVFHGKGVSTGELEQHADTAMYQAKLGGRNRVVFFEASMLESLARRTSLEADLREALPLGAMVPYFQAQVDGDDRIVGAEVLLRWRHPRRGLVPPAEFIPLAEETGLIMPLGAWVIEGACAQLERWQHDPATRHLSLSVNVSPLQFLQSGFVQHLRGLLEGRHFDPVRLQLELTESLVIRNLEEVIDRMHAVRALGIALSMDDFGTGQSSLSNLRRLPIQGLKIDKSFVQALPGGPGDLAIASSIVMMAAALGLDVVAEGVETPAQREALQTLGCWKYQGYLFGEPVPLEEFERALEASRPSSPLLEPSVP